jgi:predicted dehydrogenase
VVGVYSKDLEASKKLKDAFGVDILDSYDDALGKIDGLIITARHGDDHYKYAKPYIASGIPMFIDKPITVSEDEAVSFMRELREAGVRITGGSSLKEAKLILELKEKALSLEGGKTVGGAVRAPITMDNPYGGFYFYAQHLVEMVCEVFGRYPRSVYAFTAQSTINVLFRYENYDVTGTFCEGMYTYYTVRYAEKDTQGGIVDISDKKAFYNEFEKFYKLLCGEAQKISYDDFISPVFIMNAIERSMQTKKEEAVKEYKV